MELINMQRRLEHLLCGNVPQERSAPISHSAKALSTITRRNCSTFKKLPWATRARAISAVSQAVFLGELPANSSGYHLASAITRFLSFLETDQSQDPQSRNYHFELAVLLIRMFGASVNDEDVGSLRELAPDRAGTPTALFDLVEVCDQVVRRARLHLKA
jgi:hypothetical protein